MKGFIEVTGFDGELDRTVKMFIPIGKIMAVICDGSGEVFIETRTDGEAISSGFLVKESYGAIKRMIEESGV